MTRLAGLLLGVVVGVGTMACDTARPIAIEKAATPAPPPRANVDPDHPMIEAPRISLADAKRDYDEKSAVFVDTHSPAQFEMEHITGAINIPANELNKYFDKIPKGKKIIVYCS